MGKGVLFLMVRVMPMTGWQSWSLGHHTSWIFDNKKLNLKNIYIVDGTSYVEEYSYGTILVNYIPTTTLRSHMYCRNIIINNRD
jgi:hypothetical protein